MFGYLVVADKWYDSGQEKYIASPHVWCLTKPHWQREGDMVSLPSEVEKVFDKAPKGTVNTVVTEKSYSADGQERHRIVTVTRETI